MSKNARQQSVLVKMFRTPLVVCTFFFVASFDAAHFLNPLHLGNGRFRSSMMEHQTAEFGEGVRDWLTNMKDKIFGKKISNQMQSMSPFNLNSSPMIHFLKNNQELEQMIQSMNFFLNLSSLKFDPSKDWGFHIGSWYIIRKSDQIDEWDDNWKDFFESTSELESVDSTGDVINNLLQKTKIVSDSSKKSINENESVDNTSVEVLKPLT